jgi:hypothetical protein
MPSELDCVSRHEAAHACVFMKMGRFDKVWIWAGPGRVRGMVEHPVTDPGDPVWLAIGHYAGPVAEQLYSGVGLADQWWSAVDYRQARAALGRVPGRNDFGWVIPHTREIVRDCWPDIDRLARLLLHHGGTLSYDRCVELMGGASR